MQKQYKAVKTIGKIIATLTIAASVALVVSFAACYINPRTFWLPAFAGLAYVPLFFLNLLFLIINILRKKLIFLLPLLTILLGWNIFFATFSFSGTTDSIPDANPNYIRLFTWNVHYFLSTTGPFSNDFREQLFDVIRSSNPTVVCMQEFDAGGPDSAKAMSALRSRLNMPFSYFQSFEDPAKGIVIFSKFPIARKGMVPFSNEPSGNQCLYADINKSGKIFRVYTVHLESIKLQVKQLNYIDSLVKGKERTIRPSKKIAGQLKRAFEKRGEQAALVRKHASSCPYPYLICGDFNDPPSSYSFHTMARGLKDTFAEKGHGFFPVTYYTGFLQYQIDHILTSKQFNVMDQRIIRKKLSDHYPVFADVQLP